MASFLQNGNKKIRVGRPGWRQQTEVARQTDRLQTKRCHLTSPQLAVTQFWKLESAHVIIKRKEREKVMTLLSKCRKGLVIPESGFGENQFFVGFIQIPEGLRGVSQEGGKRVVTRGDTFPTASVTLPAVPRAKKRACNPLPETAQ